MMKQNISTVIAIAIILLFFIGAVAIFIYQYIMLEREVSSFGLYKIEREL